MTAQFGRRRPYAPDQLRVDRGDWNRASGHCDCAVCGLNYFAHVPVLGFEWLTRLCDGRLVKL